VVEKQLPRPVTHDCLVVDLYDLVALLDLAARVRRRAVLDLGDLVHTPERRHDQDALQERETTGRSDSGSSTGVGAWNFEIITNNKKSMISFSTFKNFTGLFKVKHIPSN
jgi:hypothetical protein